MADEGTKDDKPAAKADHEPPAGAETTATWTAAGVSIDYTASAKWIVLRKKEKPAAEIFSVSYVADGDGDRPVTFVFNGGPGASSAYLHMGAVGPLRVAFPADGTLPRMPPRLVSERGVVARLHRSRVRRPGRHRLQPRDRGRRQGRRGEEEAAQTATTATRGSTSATSAISSRCASSWAGGSPATAGGALPVFIAGESYGGYRVGRLVRMLQETAGIGLSGAVLISPALEFASLSPTDYDVLGWVDLVPTMAIAAVHHGRSRAFAAGTPPEDVLQEAETFATGDYATLLTRGASMPAAERDRILGRLADLIGLPADMVARAEGRITIGMFTRELLRDERKVLGLYDATITATDPFPDREAFAGPDPTLAGIGPAYTTAINRQLRSEIGVETDREYVVLSYEVNELVAQRRAASTSSRRPSAPPTTSATACRSTRT